jgi:nucleotide-binding universal stress UspA family protein
LTGSALVVVAAWQFPSTYPPGEIYDDEDPAAEMRRVLDDSVSAVRHRHGAIEVSGLLIQGDPGPILVDASRGAELLIVGSRGHGEFAEVVLGSVGMHCVTHARCPVLVYRSVRDEVTTETSGAQSPAALQ